MGHAGSAAITAAYRHASFTNGFLQGYNTMDCLASLAFGITVITAIKGLGIKRQRDISWATAKGGALGIIGIALIYIALIWLGATSWRTLRWLITVVRLWNRLPTTTCTAGDAILAVLATTTCMTSAMAGSCLFTRFPPAFS